MVPLITLPYVYTQRQLCTRTICLHKSGSNTKTCQSNATELEEGAGFLAPEYHVAEYGDHQAHVSCSPDKDRPSIPERVCLGGLNPNLQVVRAPGVILSDILVAQVGGRVQSLSLRELQS